MKYITSALILALPLLAHAGIVTNGTRFIYSSSTRDGIVVILKNTGPERYLIQSEISSNLPVDNFQAATENSDRAPFIVIPPLFAINSYGENMVRILRTGGKIPEDRESVFSLSVAAIPSTRPQANSVQWAVRTHFKLFYRPDGLKGNPQKAYRQLQWARQGNSVTVYNPTPYYVTLFGVKINGATRPDAGMVSPFTTHAWSWCPKSGECELQWQGIDDYGAATLMQHINLLYQ